MSAREYALEDIVEVKKAFLKWELEAKRDNINKKRAELNNRSS